MVKYLYGHRDELHCQDLSDIVANIIYKWNLTDMSIDLNNNMVCLPQHRTGINL